VGAVVQLPAVAPGDGAGQRRLAQSGRATEPAPLPRQLASQPFHLRFVGWLPGPIQPTPNSLTIRDNAAYYNKPIVQEWLRRHPEFHLEPVPPYSPNVNLIERLWRFLRQKALRRWHKTFEAMQEAVSEVLDHLEQYQDELATLMVDTFHIIEKRAIPIEYKAVA
jgi:transposase